MSLFGLFKSQSEIAEEYLRQNCNETHISALVRHYSVSETNQHIEHFSGARITDQQAADLV
ncbi:MAG TPA: hypothetical protein VFV38_13490, partial [Ktedonobacteraceae bacterium]|nr:hypothetical protein [Ktedonobacteraceae bacterium]